MAHLQRFHPPVSCTCLFLAWPEVLLLPCRSCRSRQWPPCRPAVPCHPVSRHAWPGLKAGSTALQMLREQEMLNKGGAAYQRLTWDALRKSINGLVNKVNAENIRLLLPEIFAEVGLALKEHGKCTAASLHEGTSALFAQAVPGLLASQDAAQPGSTS